jgi:FMN phosphatase YigB (HAD superfamily)
MIKAVLLDLDNTLLEASDSCFVQGYFHLVERYFRDNMNYDGMYNALINSVRAMYMPS